jgi:hypothetical protein
MDGTVNSTDNGKGRRCRRHRSGKTTVMAILIPAIPPRAALECESAKSAGKFYNATVRRLLEINRCNSTGASPTWPSNMDKNGLVFRPDRRETLHGFGSEPSFRSRTKLVSNNINVLLILAPGLH